MGTQKNQQINNGAWWAWWGSTLYNLHLRESSEFRCLAWVLFDTASPWRTSHLSVSRCWCCPEACFGGIDDRGAWDPQRFGLPAWQVQCLEILRGPLVKIGLSVPAAGPNRVTVKSNQVLYANGFKLRNLGGLSLRDVPQANFATDHFHVYIFLV